MADIDYEVQFNHQRINQNHERFNFRVQGVIVGSWGCEIRSTPGGNVTMRVADLVVNNGEVSFRGKRDCVIASLRFRTHSTLPDSADAYDGPVSPPGSLAIDPDAAKNANPDWVWLLCRVVDGNRQESVSMSTGSIILLH